MKTVHAFPIPAFKDNYFWLLHDGVSAVVVDPGAAEPVEAHLAKLGLRLEAIILTHLHYDHCWGVPALLAAWPVPVYGPLLNDYDRATHPPFPVAGTTPLDCVTHVVAEGDTVVLHSLHMELKVLAVPGHTRGHLAYWDQARGRLFTGDTLFAGGCGRVFGGSMADMLASLDRLASLPDDTGVYCAHEYTLANLRFGLAVEPGNAALVQRYEDEQAKRDKGLPTLPSSIGLEKASNPFLRVREPEVAAALNLATADACTRFEALRLWKNKF